MTRDKRRDLIAASIIAAVSIGFFAWLIERMTSWYPIDTTTSQPAAPHG